MDIAKINDWLQVLGIFGVIASLIFVGLQMKQTQEIALAETYNARAAQTIGGLCERLGFSATFFRYGKDLLGQA